MAGPGRDVAGLRVCPAELRFPDAVPGGRYRAQLCVQNLQAGTRRLRLLQPRQPQVSAEEPQGGKGRVPTRGLGMGGASNRGRGLQNGWSVSTPEAGSGRNGRSVSAGRGGAGVVSGGGAWGGRSVPNVGGPGRNVSNGMGGA